MNIKYIFLPAIIILDISTKLSVNQDLGGVQYHEKHIGSWFLLVIVWCCWIFKRYPLVRLPVAVAITGGALNYLDTLNGVAINPFILIVSETLIGFNIADIAIILGVGITIITLFKHKKEIGSIKWKNA